MNGSEPQRLRARFGAAEVVAAPCPHLVVDDVFSAEFLGEWYAQLPDETVFRDDNYGLRTFQTWAAAEDLGRLDPWKQAFYTRTLPGLLDQALAELILARFRPHLEASYRELFGAGAGAMLSRVALDDWDQAGALNIRAPGSTLAAHLDWPNRLISVVFYLDPGGRHAPDWGTRLFRVHRERVDDPLALMAKRATEPAGLVDPDDHLLVEFRPNRAIAFMNTPWSQHGAVVDGPGDAARWCFVKGINMTLDATDHIFGLPPQLRG